MTYEIRVKSKTNTLKLADSIARALDCNQEVEVQSIGASATNQAIKGIAVARQRVTTKGRDAITRQGFGTAIINGEEKSVIKQVVKLV